MNRNAAHFLLVPELAYSPPNEAIVSAYLEAGYDVDLYAPGGVDTSEYGTRVRSHNVRYERKWILQNLCSMRWRRYAVASGTSENPIGLVGLLARLYRFPHFCLVDEIMSGTYSGDASPSWKALCKRTMRTSQFNIVNDVTRIELLRDYASLPSESKVLVYPGCFRQLPPLGSRDEIRHSWNMPLDAFAMCHSGAFNMTCGADWIWQAMSQTESLHMILQPMKMDSLLRSTMDYLPFRRRLYIEDRRLSWEESWRLMAGVDVGLVIYRNQAPQFQNMGLSSNKLCMFLAMNVPVIALEQPSFRFLKEYDCGILVNRANGFASALDSVQSRLDEMRSNAKRCFDEYMRVQDSYGELASAIKNL